MQNLTYQDNHYRTPAVQSRSLLARLLPSMTFYSHFVRIVWRSAEMAKQGCYDDQRWLDSSLEVMLRLEQIGVVVDIEGIEHLHSIEGPVVFIGNHMSMMETLLLPAMIQPVKPVTFVIKESLLNYPVFKHVMRSRRPVAVTRTNPRQDLKIVMAEGVERLSGNMSIVVFPQTTRTHSFDPAQMSSIGVKLAKKAGVPIIPVALRTDCWRNGSILKDFGRFDTDRPAHFAFGKPLVVEGKGDAEQTVINEFIADKLQQWKSS